MTENTSGMGCIKFVDCADMRKNDMLWDSIQDETSSLKESWFLLPVSLVLLGDSKLILIFIVWKIVLRKICNRFMQLLFYYPDPPLLPPWDRWGCCGAIYLLFTENLPWRAGHPGCFASPATFEECMRSSLFSYLNDNCIREIPTPLHDRFWFWELIRNLRCYPCCWTKNFLSTGICEL